MVWRRLNFWLINIAFGHCFRVSFELSLIAGQA